MTHRYSKIDVPRVFIQHLKRMLFLALILTGLQTQAQVSAYSFIAESGTFTPLVGGTAVAIQGDDILSGTLALPFSFTFNGVAYSNFKASSNGWLTFNTAATSSTLTNDLDFSLTTIRPLLAPLWDDQDGTALYGAVASYQTSGVSPNQVFTMEWKSWQWNYTATTAVISYQVKLYETTNVIEFIYQQEAGAIAGTGSASIGIAGATTGVGNFLSLNNSGAAPTASSVTETINISTKPATGQVYRFTPPDPCTGTPEAGTAPLTASACTGVGGVNSISATGYTTGVTGITFQWEESNDDGVGDAWADAVGGTGATTATYTMPALASPIYYRCRVTCTTSGEIDYTNSTAVSLVDCTYDIAYTTGEAFTSIMPANGGSGTAYAGWVGVSGDDNTTTPVSLTGTTFTYQGNPVTQFVACTNGWMSLTAATSTTFSNALGSTTQTKVLAPFWDDLVLTGNAYANRDACMRYQIDGTLGSGTAVITVEWAGMERYTVAGPNLNFQVKLHEDGNVIEYIYGNFEGFDGTVTSSYSYSIGQNGTNPAGLTSIDRFALQAPAVTNYWKSTSDPANHTYMPDCYSKFTLTPGVYTGPIVAPVIPAPGNDNVGTAYPLAVNLVPCSTPNLCDTYYNSRNATNSGLGTACVAAGNEDDDVFFTFVTTAATDYVITVRSAPGYDAVVQLLDAGLTQVLCQNLTASGGIETMNASGLVAGGSTYYVRIFHNAIGSGTTGQFSICVNQLTPPPANDDCSGAIGLAVGTSCSYTAGSSITATATVGEVAACTGTADDDVWYSFVATDAAPVISVQSGAGYNAVFSVYSGSCGALSQLYCVNVTSTAGFESINTAGLVVGNTYYIRVYHFAAGAGSGAFDICVYNPVPGCTTYTSPANAATGIVTTGTTLSWSSALYATSYDVYFGDNPTPPFITNTAGTTYATGTLVAGTTYYWQIIPKNLIGEAAGCSIYSFTTVPECAGTPVAGAATSTAASVCGPLTTFTLNAVGSTTDDGTTYQWQSDNGGGWVDIPGATTLSYVATETETNDYRIIVTCSFSGDSDTSSTVNVIFNPAPTGDVISDPIIVAVLPASFNGDNLSANCWTNNIGNTSPDVYYQVIPDCNGTMTAATCASTGTLSDTYIRILDALGVELASDDDGCPGFKSTETISVSAGVTYYVVVEGYSAGEGTYTVDISTTSSFATFYADLDGDAYGDLLNTVDVCDGIAPVGYVGNSDDCDDSDPAVNPTATEVCNGYDDDCDGLSDDADPGVIGLSTWFADADGDGFGDAGVSALACFAPLGYVDNADDCDDLTASTNPGADEICGNGVDDNCSGEIDEGTVFETWYADADEDSYGDAGVSVVTCDGAPTGYVADATDCDDTNAAINPGAAEVCNGIDDNCNGSIDDGLPLNTYYADSDSDGYGDAGSSISICDAVAPSGYTTDNTDCNDANAAVNPGATEICNGIDDNCDGNTDDGLITAVITAGGPTTFCQGESVTLFATAGDGYTYQWKNGGANIPGATSSSLVVTKTGSLIVVITIPGGCSDESDPVATTRLPRPISNVINGDATNDLCFDASIKLKANLTTGVTYQWWKGGTMLAGATGYLYYATTPGNYKIQQTSTATGCFSFSPPYSIIKTCREDGFEDVAGTEMINVYPNPAVNEFTVEVNLVTSETEAMISVYNSLGEEVYNGIAAITNGNIFGNINLGDQIAGGLYVVKVSAGSTELTRQIMIQK